MNRNRHRRLTLPELKPFVAQYHAQFPGWKRTFTEAFGREAGAVAQEIGFERLRYGAYRPISCVRIFVAPSGRTLHQMLNVKVRQVEPRQHDQVFPQVVEAMHREIVPSVDGQLLPVDILQRYESELPHKSPHAHDLAALNAYLGQDERALYWCRRFVELVEKESSPWQECDLKRHAFLQQLAQWIENGEAKPQLEEVIESERKRLKYTG